MSISFYSSIWLFGWCRMIHRLDCLQKSKIVHHLLAVSQLLYHHRRKPEASWMDSDAVVTKKSYIVIIVQSTM